MDTNQNKAALWRSCVEQGIFNQIPPSMIHPVQGLFEKTIKELANDSLDISFGNQLFMKEFKIRLSNMTGIPIQSQTFEDTEKEYMSMLEAPKPARVDFTQELDKPNENLQEMIEEKERQREIEVNRLFNEEHKNKVMGIVSPTINQVLGTTTVNTNNSTNTNDMYKMIQSQNKVLQNILESQIKIIEMLSKSKK
jgi:hypothetical protein